MICGNAQQRANPIANPSIRNRQGGFSALTLRKSIQSLRQHRQPDSRQGAVECRGFFRREATAPPQLAVQGLG